MPRPVRPPLRVLFGVGVVAGSTLALQVLLTRLLSAVLFYHFSFLAISLALLGVGGGALLVTVRPHYFERRPLELTLSRWSVVYALALVVSLLVIVRLDFSFPDEVTARFVLVLAATCLLAFMPFLAAGVVIALAIRGYTATVGVVYAFDLVGAGTGALVIVPLLWLVPAPTLCVALAIVAGCAALLFAPWGTGESRWGVAVTGAGLLVTILSATTSLTYLPPRYSMPPGAIEVADRWGPLSRVLGYHVPSSTFDQLRYDRVYAPVIRHGADEPYPDWRDLKLGPQSIGYELTGPGDTLIIGGGGGRDIYNALSADQERVDVIELNQLIRDVVDDDLAEWSGSPYTQPGVDTAIGDGRSVLASRDAKYDTVQLSFTDTLSANSASAFALTENNLYTLEAFGEYFDHLEPDGVLNVSRLYRLVGDEALRATVLVLAALEEQGVEHPEDNVVVILGRDILGEEYGTILARLEPYTDIELEQVRALADKRGEGVAYARGGPYQREWVDLAEARSWRSFCESYRLDVCPPTDDQPFFFNMKRIGDVGRTLPGYIYSVDPVLVLAITLLVLLVIAAFAYVLPLVLTKGTERPAASSLVYFGAIGLGFLILEIVLIQRFVLFLGFPTYALSVVLFALLVCTGIGSAITNRARDPRRFLLVALVAVVVLIGVSSFALQPLLRALIDLPFAVRVVVSVALLAPFGVTMGMAMPIGLRRLEALNPSGVPYAWGVNGIASVVASVIAVLVALYWGFAVASLVALAFYCVAFAHALVGRWPASTRDGAGAPGDVDSGAGGPARKLTAVSGNG